MIGIYRIINTENGKMYIGQSKDINHRKACHKYDLENGRHKNKDMQNDYNINKDVFVFELICECRKEYLDELEMYFINKYQTYNSLYGYNMAYGGKGKNKGIMTERAKNNISKAQMGNKHMCGIKLSEEWKKHLSDAQPHKKKVECIETGIVYESFADAARKTGLNRTKIVSCCTGKAKSTGGYHFRYAEKGTSDRPAD